ncbi:MAG: long-chain fatty acid--CoA ligase [Acidobacteriota bacterium]
MSETIVSRLQAHARNHGQAAAYSAKVGDAWADTSWAEFDAQVSQVGRALIALGVPAGGTLAILSFNRPEWAISCLGAMAAGSVPVGIYQTCAANQVSYIAQHAESKVLVVENLEQWEKVREVRDELSALEFVIVLGSEIPDAPGVLGWEEFLERGEGIDPSQLDQRHQAIQPDHLAVLIYTSGTTGTPKGVMLTHSNLMETARICDGLHGLGGGDSTLSYLPMAHIAEQMISIHLAVYSGYQVYYAESIEKLAENLGEVRPTIFFGVPRVWERIHASVMAKVEAAPGWRRRLALWAFEVGRQVAGKRLRGEPVPGTLALRGRLADRLVLAKVRDKLGMGRIKLSSSGAAPIRYDVLEFFAALGVVIYEVYGLSETCGPGTWNHAGLARLGTVGPVLPEIELKIADDGEVLFRGANVFAGYFKNPEATAEALADGWFHTGDIGSLDSDQFLTITGRKKELIITSGGKNIAPSGIEAKLKQHELIGEAVVIGDARRFLSALIVLEEEAGARFAAEHGIDGALHEDPQLVAAVQGGVDQVNATVARVESIRKFHVLPRPFSLEDGELTPTLKLKRQVIEANWAEVIEAMYA